MPINKIQYGSVQLNILDTPLFTTIKKYLVNNNKTVDTHDNKVIKNGVYIKDNHITLLYGLHDTVTNDDVVKTLCKDLSCTHDSITSQLGMQGLGQISYFKLNDCDLLYFGVDADTQDNMTYLNGILKKLP